MPALLGGRLVSKAPAATALTPGLGLQALENRGEGQEWAENHRMDSSGDCDTCVVCETRFLVSRRPSAARWSDRRGCLRRHWLRATSHG